MNTPKSQMDEFPFLPALVLLGAFCLVVAVLLAGQPKPEPQQVAALPTETATQIPPTPTETQAPTEVAAAYDAALVSQGQTQFNSICMACHGMDARGIPGLGKDLLASEFVHSLSDEELLQFIIVGRQPWDEGNTTGIAMPARGGNPSLTDDQIIAIIAYLRTEAVEQGFGGAAVASQPTTVPAATLAPTQLPTQLPTEGAAVSPTAAPPTAVPATMAPPEPREGETSYSLLCASCHGPNGEGTEYNGPAITDSTLVQDDTAFTDFLTNVEPVAPEQGFVHPVRGGYMPLTNEEIEPLIDYVQELVNGN